jgi:hypothetical protein
MVLVGAQAATATAPARSAGYSDPTTPSSQTVNEQATVAAGNSDPNIECAWALPDLNPIGGAEWSISNPSVTNFAGAPYTDGIVGNGGATPPSASGANAISYGLDDDPSTVPSPTPCDLGAPGTAPNPGGPVQAPGQHHLVQVLPNADDCGAWTTVKGLDNLLYPSCATPSPRRIELWAAVDDTVGISSITNVWWDIYHGDGSLKFQVYGVPVVLKDPPSPSDVCHGPSGMFTAAGPPPLGNGELTSSAINGTSTQEGMVQLCEQGLKEYWHQAFDVSKDQPNGEYHVVAHVTDSSGATSSLDYYIDVIPFFDLAVDNFTANFGAYAPNTLKTLGGDLVFLPGDGKETVTNRGNSGEQIGLQFYPLQGATLHKCITNFDANLGMNDPATGNLNLQHITASTTCPNNVPTPSGVTWFNARGVQLVCPNDDEKLDLSIDRPEMVPADTYQGKVIVIARSSSVFGTGNGGCPTDNGSPYRPQSGIRT